MSLRSSTTVRVSSSGRDIDRHCRVAQDGASRVRPRFRSVHAVGGGLARRWEPAHPDPRGLECRGLAPSVVGGHGDAGIGCLGRVALDSSSGGSPLLEDLRDELHGWTEVARDAGPFLALGLCSSQWLERALPRLNEASGGAILAGDDFVHCDVWSDNICFEGGRTLLIDWNSAWVGNSAIDVADGFPAFTGKEAPPPPRSCPISGSWPHSSVATGPPGRRAFPLRGQARACERCNSSNSRAPCRGPRRRLDYLHQTASSLLQADSFVGIKVPVFEQILPKEASRPIDEPFTLRGYGNKCRVSFAVGETGGK